MTPSPIQEFKNDYYFLHPHFPCTVMFDGMDFPSAEHAYQAARVSDPSQRLVIREILDGRTAASYGQRIRPSKVFDAERLAIMETIVQSKFFDNIKLAKMLLETGERQLMYGNAIDSHGSQFWGLLRGKGQNHLGRILMQTRKLIRVAHDRSLAARMKKVSFSGHYKPDGELRIDLTEEGQKAFNGD